MFLTRVSLVLTVSPKTITDAAAGLPLSTTGGGGASPLGRHIPEGQPQCRHGMAAVVRVAPAVAPVAVGPADPGGPPVFSVVAAAPKGSVAVAVVAASSAFAVVAADPEGQLVTARGSGGQTASAAPAAPALPEAWSGASRHRGGRHVGCGFQVGNTVLVHSGETPKAFLPVRSSKIQAFPAVAVTVAGMGGATTGIRVVISVVEGAVSIAAAAGGTVGLRLAGCWNCGGRIRSITAGPRRGLDVLLLLLVLIFENRGLKPGRKEIVKDVNRRTRCRLKPIVGKAERGRDDAASAPSASAASEKPVGFQQSVVTIVAVAAFVAEGFQRRHSIGSRGLVTVGF